MLGGVHIFVDQAVEDGFSADLPYVDVGTVAGWMSRSVSGTRWSMPWCGRVVVDLVLDQDGAQMRLAEDQHAVEELPAQGCACRKLIRAGQAAFWYSWRMPPRRSRLWT